MQRTIVQISQLGFCDRTIEFKFKTPQREAKRLPTITTAEGVAGFQRFFLHQRMGNSAGYCDRQANALLVEQHRFFTRNQRSV